MCATIEWDPMNVHGMVVKLRENAIDLLKVPLKNFNLLSSETRKYSQGSTTFFIAPDSKLFLNRTFHNIVTVTLDFAFPPLGCL